MSLDVRALLQSVGLRIGEFVYRIRNGIAVSNVRYQRRVDQVHDAGSALVELSDEQLQQQARALANQIRCGARTLNDAAVEVFALAREAASRSLGMRPYDVQILAAFALHDGMCVEMQTGEGKTLAAAVAVCLRALAGTGVHVLTFNDYLAERDANWMRPLYEFFGLSVGYVAQTMSTSQRRDAYACDITYVTARESGFDFLRDQACLDSGERVHRGFQFAVIDEADSILIDEARIPLVIAAEDELDDANLSQVAQHIDQLTPGHDYEVKNEGRLVTFTDAGLSHLESKLGCGQLHSEPNVDLLTRLNVALHAKALLVRDVDYIVRDGKIELIDEFTGRVAQHRRWPGGINAALEAKEGLTIQPQGRILNSITLQHFLELYPQLCGMTGTAKESAAELYEFYDLKVVVIPPNRPCIRRDHHDHLFSDADTKLEALVDEICRVHQQGRPILVGTGSVNESERLADRILQQGVDCRVLNAANDHQEAEIIAEAGALSAVTISTNMAGRGTDIKLGGSDERQRDQVVRLGGLYVIGTNRHESRRIDNQLRGRAGRQGDPGESRFFISLQDDLITRFGAGEFMLRGYTLTRGAIDDPDVARRVAHLQRVIEGQSFEIRQTLRRYSKLLEKQRQAIEQRCDGLAVPESKPTTLPQHAPELYSQLTSRWGETLIDDAARKVELRHIERIWSDHLGHAAEIRDHIHLVSLGGFNAFDEFNRQMNFAFRSLGEEIAAAVVTTMQTAEITDQGLDLDRAGLRRPSSTWTFMINDNPKGSVLDQLTQGILRLVKRQR